MLVIELLLGLQMYVQFKNFWESIFATGKFCRGVARCILLRVFDSNFWAFSCISQPPVSRSLWPGYRWKDLFLLQNVTINQFWWKVMTSELEQRPTLVTACYGRHGSQWVNNRKKLTGNSFFFQEFVPFGHCLWKKENLKISLRPFGSITLSCHQTNCGVNLTYLRINNENISLVFPGA